jgi:hypothetical protein
MKIVANIDLLQNQLQNALLHPLAAAPGTPAAGQVYFNTVSLTAQVYTGVAWLVFGRLDQISPPTADVDLNGQKIINLATPTNVGDATTKAYVDGLAGGGVQWKNPVRAATVGAGVLATAFENGDTIDGVVLATGDRILLKDQGAGAENGIYIVQAAGAPVRASDADTASEFPQMAMFVQEGTVNADTAWVMTNNGAIVVGTTALVFVQFSGLGQVTAGAGLTKTGATLDAGAGTGITVNANDIALTVPVTVALGGTGAITLLNHGVLLGQGAAAVAAVAVGATGTVLRGATGADPAFGAVALTTDVTGVLPVANGGTAGATAAAARAALAVPGTFSVDCAAALSTVVTHNLGTRDVVVSVRRTVTPWDIVLADVEATSINTVTVRFATAPAAGDYRITVVG